jgi:hypothetical protein
MDAGAILREFTFAEGLPREALKAASAQRVEMLPLFVEEIQTYLCAGTCGAGNADTAVLHLSSARRVARKGRL